MGAEFRVSDREEPDPIRSLGSLGGHDLVEDIYTLSPLQQGMLFHILSAPERGLYFDQTVCTIVGSLDEDALRWAWQQVLARHPSLRSSLLWDGLAKPVQVVHAQVPLALRVSDWRRMEPRVQKLQFEALLEDDRREGVDLAKPPLLRIHLIRLRARRSLLLFSVSHLVADGWCSAILLDEVVRHYEARRQGRELQLPPAPPYRDFIAWLKRQDLSAAERFWRQGFEGFGRPTLLAAGPSAPSGRRYRQESLELSRRLSDELRALARSRHLTLNTVVQGAWALLLAVETESDDVVFGVTVSGRSASLPGVDGMIGLLVNTLPFRVPVDPQERLVSWLEQLQLRQLSARDYEHSPLSRVQAWAGLSPGEALFDSIFVFLNAFDPRRHDTGSLEIEGLRHLSRPHYNLSLQVVPADSLRIEAVFAVEQLAWARLHGLLETLEELLERMAEEPEAPLSRHLDAARSFARERGREHRRRRRDTNSGRLRDTRPVPIRLEEAE